MVTVKEMKARYGCSNPTARKYLRQVEPHLESPLVAPEWAVKEWEQKRMVFPVEVTRQRMNEVRTKMNAERVIVPRKR